MAINGQIRDRAPAEQVYYRSITGWPSLVESPIRRKIGALQRHGAFHIKIGITNAPSRRWQEAYRHRGWVTMHVLYSSTSHLHVCDLERKMVARFRSGLMRSNSWFYNVTNGGGGAKPHSGPYYLYLVTAPRFARLT